MESKKINQLATEMAPAPSDLTIIGDPITGVSKKITLLQIADLFTTIGTVTSVAVTETGNALTITGSPITSAGTINIGFAGDATQYVRGDGALADFPTSTGGGSSVSYYLNSSVSQGTIGGVAYREFSKDPISGAGTDITASTNGYIASYITDANDPALLEVPAGNFNCEFYFSVNSNAHNPYVYAEVYKYDGTTFTLIGSSQSVPEYLTNGTTLSPYYFAIPVTQTTLSITDRIAIRIYVNVDTRVVTLHTENNHLCQVVTTFSKGLTSLNNLTRQVQFLATGTSGTDFNISSSTATHTFNLPVASATNTGKLSSTDWSTFNNKQPAGNYVTIDTTETITGSKTFSNPIKNDGGISLKNGASYSGTGYMNLGGMTDGLRFTSGGGISNFFALPSSVGYTYTFPAATGTLALTSNLSSYVPYTGATTSVDLGANSLTANTLLGKVIFATNSVGTSSGLMAISIGSTFSSYSGHNTIGAAANGVFVFISDISSGTAIKDARFDFGSLTNGTTRTFTFPDATGTIALTSNLSSYVPYSGATANLNLGVYGLTSGGLTISKNGSAVSGLIFEQAAGLGLGGAGFTTIGSIGSDRFGFYFGGATQAFVLNASGITTQRAYTMPDATGTLALTSDINSAVSGTTGRVPLFTSTNVIGNSQIYDNGTTIGVGSSVTSANKLVSVLTTDSNTAYAIMAWGTGVNTGGFYSDVKSGNIFLGHGEVGGVSAERFKVTNAGNLSASGTATLGGALSGTSAAFSGNISLNNTITTSSTSLIFQQTGDVYGTTQLLLLNRDGSNGAIFKNLGLDVVDFGFVTSSTAQGNVRFEKRAGNRLTDNTTGEFQFVINASSGFAYFQSGFFATSISQGNLLVGTTTNSIYKLDVVGTARISGASTFSANVAINGTIIGTDQTFGGAYRTFAFGTNANGFNRIFAANDATDGMYLNAATGQGINFRVNGGGSNVFTIASTGAASFLSSIDVATNARFRSASNWMQFEENALSSLNNDGAHIRSVVSADIAPTYSWKGDQDTGMYTPAANTIAFTTGGGEQMRITSGGDVLIGSTGGSHKLSVTVQSGADREIIIAGVSGASNGFRVQWNNATSTTRVSINNIPTSSAGLPAGTIYSSAGVLMIA
jgi:hypothetical protein